LGDIPVRLRFKKLPRDPKPQGKTADIAYELPRFRGIRDYNFGSHKLQDGEPIIFFLERRQAKKIISVNKCHAHFGYARRDQQRAAVAARLEGQSILRSIYIVQYEQRSLVEQFEGKAVTSMFVITYISNPQLLAPLNKY
jgi:hypothetical protein